MGRSLIDEQITLLEENGPVTCILMSSDAEVRTSLKTVAGESAYMIEIKSLIVLQVYCRNAYNH